MSAPAIPRPPSVVALRLRDLWAWAGLAALTLSAYAAVLGAGFVWDDDHHVTTAALASRHGLWRIWFELGSTQQYYPALFSVFWIEHRLWGDAALGYHLANLFLHVTAAWLFGLTLRRLAIPGAWLGAVIFALHPVGVESAAWISEQKNTLSTVFYLLAALTYLRFDSVRGRGRDRERGRALSSGIATADYRTQGPTPYAVADDRIQGLTLYAVATGLFLCALLSKTVTATLPAALLVVFWWQRGRLTWRGDVRPLLPWFAVGAGAGLFSAWVERTYIGAQGADFRLGLIQRCLVAGRAFWFYLGKLAWPAHLIFIYPHWRIDAAAAAQYLFPLGALALAAALWLARRRTRAPLAALLFYAGSLFPTLGFFNVYPFIFSYVADHWQYLAAMGMIALAAGGWGTWLRRTQGAEAGRLRLGAPQLAALAVVGALWIQTWRQVRFYHDGETLYRMVLARNTGSWMAHNNLGLLLAQEPGRADEALAHYEEALRLRPDYPEAHYNLGILLMDRPGRAGDALAQFAEAVRLKPDYVEARGNLGVALLQVPGRLDDATAQFEEALRLDPAYAEAHNGLGDAFSRMPGRTDDAIRQYEEAVRLQPGYVEAHNNLGNALRSTPGRADAAIAEYREALRLKPSYAEAHYNLAIALTDRGRGDDAIGEYREALRLKPDYAEAHYNLGNLLATRPGRLAEAAAEYREALRLEPDNPAVHYNLGNALARARGQLAAAIAEYEAALQLRPDYAEAHNNLANALAQAPGRLDEAIAEYQTALRLKPDYVDAHNNLGNALRRSPGRLGEAVAQYEEALRLRPDAAAIHFNLAIALLRLPGRRAEAAAQLETAVRLDPALQPARQLLARLRALPR